MNPCPCKGRAPKEVQDHHGYCPLFPIRRATFSEGDLGMTPKRLRYHMMGDDRFLRVDVAIPAYNEEFRISGILQDVVSSIPCDWFQVQHIYVISDASTDQTEELVRGFSKSDERVRLIQKPERKGKNDSINLAFEQSNADVLIMLDADIRLATDKVLQNVVEPIYRHRVGLVGANVLPDNAGSTFNPAILARRFDWQLECERRKRKPISYWSFYGRALALSKDLFHGLVLPKSHADDLFIYYSCRRIGLEAWYAKDAWVYFKGPNSIRDFVDQYSRFKFWLGKAREEFGSQRVKTDLEVPGMAGYALSTLVRHPYWGMMWAGCQLTSLVAHLIRYRTGLLERGIYKTWVLDGQGNDFQNAGRDSTF